VTDRLRKNAKVCLVPVTKANRALVTSLELAPGQMDYVASNLESLDEADNDDDARPLAVMAEDCLVGFVMYEAPLVDDEARIYRFMIDRRYQARGYGKAALREALDQIRGLGHVRHVSICYALENEGARHLYRAAGFVEHGLDEDGEMVADLVLPA
jgi:diamine N-acetyltransferase